MAFAFGAHDDLAGVRDRLRGYFGDPGPPYLRTPVGQLVKSLISSRTRDEVSRAAAKRLEAHFADWPALAAASEDEIESVIADVTFPDVKARHLRQALRDIAAFHSDFDLTFLKNLGVPRALGWLERLPGVGRKVAASTLNFSPLAMPSFVIDTHILRILHRFGFVRSNADIRAAYDRVMAIVPDWSAQEFGELHMLVKRLGQVVCTANEAGCAACPISQRCRTAAASTRLTAPRPS